MQTKTLPQISSTLNSLNAEVTIYRATYQYTADEERWGCSITVASGGTEIKVREMAATMPEAVFMAFSKLEPLIQAPAVAQALSLPLLAGPVE